MGVYKNLSLKGEGFLFLGKGEASPWLQPLAGLPHTPSPRGEPLKPPP